MTDWTAICIPAALIPRAAKFAMYRRSARMSGTSRLTDLVGFDAVLHLAALSNDPLGNLKPGLTDEINHRASVRIAELAKKAGVRRFVLRLILQQLWSGRRGND